MRIENAGENSIIAWFAEQASPEVSEKVFAICEPLERRMGGALIDLVPSYVSLLIVFDPFQTDHSTVRQQLVDVAAESTNIHTTGKLVKLPVLYGEPYGPDIKALAERAGITQDKVAELHQAQEYRVYAIGFTPGFAYLGEVDERIAAQRLATPRQRVPRGSVGIADRQTAVYPAESPGGWNLIGLCPTLLFDPDADPPMPVVVGDSVRFVAIDEAQYLKLGGEL